MSLGLTPSEFVRDVIFTQEKVLLEFYPTDDKFKEVLTDGNYVLQELQKEEDWLWLRKTKALGVTTKPPEHIHHHHYHWGIHCWPVHRLVHQKRLRIPLTKDIYKPSGLYGDCVRLARYRFKPEFLEAVEVYTGYWRKYIKDNDAIEADKAFVYASNLELEYDPSTDDIEYGGTFPYQLMRKSRAELRSLLEVNKWYVDVDGRCYIAKNLYEETESNPSTDPNVIWMVDAPEDPYPAEPPTEPYEPHKHHHHCKLLWDDELTNFYDVIDIDEFDSIRVPYISAGNNYRINVNQYGRTLNHIETPDMELGCTAINGELVFNRPLHPFEMDRVVLMDSQMRIEPFHVCDDNCISELEAQGHGVSTISYPNNPCHEHVVQSNKKMLTEIPDPNYVVIKTAQYHAQGSPFSQGIIPNLQDRAQKILSTMRSANAMATSPDSLDWCPIDFVEVI